MMTAGEKPILAVSQDQPVFVQALNCSDKDQLADVSSLIFVDPSAFAHASCIKGSNPRERRSVKIHTCCRQ